MPFSCIYVLRPLRSARVRLLRLRDVRPDEHVDPVELRVVSHLRRP